MKLSNIIAASAISLFSLTSANAASITYVMNFANELADGPNYGTVTISDGADASNAEYVDFSVEIIGSEFAPFGDNFGMDSFYFNASDSVTVTEANIIDIDPASWDINFNKNAGGGYGFFDIQSKGDGGSRTLNLSFSIANIIGDTIADYSLPGEEGYWFAAHVGGFGEDGELSSKIAGRGGLRTDTPPVPVPAAVWLMGSALGALGFSRRKKTQS